MGAGQQDFTVADITDAAPSDADIREAFRELASPTQLAQVDGAVGFDAVRYDTLPCSTYLTCRDLLSPDDGDERFGRSTRPRPQPRRFVAMFVSWVSSVCSVAALAFWLLGVCSGAALQANAAM